MLTTKRQYPEQVAVRPKRLKLPQGPIVENLKNNVPIDMGISNIGKLEVPFINPLSTWSSQRSIVNNPLTTMRNAWNNGNNLIKNTPGFVSNGKINYVKIAANFARPILKLKKPDQFLFARREPVKQQAGKRTIGVKNLEVEVAGLMPLASANFFLAHIEKQGEKNDGLSAEEMWQQWNAFGVSTVENSRNIFSAESNDRIVVCSIKGANVNVNCLWRSDYLFRGAKLYFILKRTKVDRSRFILNDERRNITNDQDSPVILNKRPFQLFPFVSPKGFDCPLVSDLEYEDEYGDKALGLPIFIGTYECHSRYSSEQISQEVIMTNVTAEDRLDKIFIRLDPD